MLFTWLVRVLTREASLLWDAARTPGVGCCMVGSAEPQVTHGAMGPLGTLLVLSSIPSSAYSSGLLSTGYLVKME